MCYRNAVCVYFCVTMVIIFFFLYHGSTSLKFIRIPWCTIKTMVYEYSNPSVALSYLCLSLLISDVSKHIEELDEDLAITYSQTATVLPHARYDCTLAFWSVKQCGHSCKGFVFSLWVFTYLCVLACSSRAEQDVSGPLQDNAKHCDQCFCYICDKLASMVSSLASDLI